MYASYDDSYNIIVLQWITNIVAMENKTLVKQQLKKRRGIENYMM